MVSAEMTVGHTRHSIVAHCPPVSHVPVFKLRQLSRAHSTRLALRNLVALPQSFHTHNSHRNLVVYKFCWKRSLVRRLHLLGSARIGRERQVGQVVSCLKLNSASSAVELIPRLSAMKRRMVCTTLRGRRSTRTRSSRRRVTGH